MRTYPQMRTFHIIERRPGIYQIEGKRIESFVAKPNANPDELSLQLSNNLKAAEGSVFIYNDSAWTYRQNKLRTIPTTGQGFVAHHGFGVREAKRKVISVVRRSGVLSWEAFDELLINHPDPRVQSWYDLSRTGLSPRSAHSRSVAMWMIIVKNRIDRQYEYSAKTNEGT